MFWVLPSRRVVLCPAVFRSLRHSIKLTSKGPVFFRQERVGQYGVRFQFLKFRSTYVSTDAAIHKEYVKKFIACKADGAAANGDKKVTYNMTNDPRVTWIGKSDASHESRRVPRNSGTWCSVKCRSLAAASDPGRDRELMTSGIGVACWNLCPGITGLLAGTWTQQDHIRRDGSSGPAVFAHVVSNARCEILLQTRARRLSGDGATEPGISAVAPAFRNAGESETAEFILSATAGQLL